MVVVLVEGNIFLKNIIDGHGRFPKNLEGGPDMCFLVRNASQDKIFQKISVSHERSLCDKCGSYDNNGTFARVVAGF